jgi:hypothetical protein
MSMLSKPLLLTAISPFGALSERHLTVGNFALDGSRLEKAK